MWFEFDCKMIWFDAAWLQENSLEKVFIDFYLYTTLPICCPFKNRNNMNYYREKQK